MLMTRKPNAGTNHKTKIGNESLKSVISSKYFGTTNQNCIQEEIKSKLKSGCAGQVVLVRVCWSGFAGQGVLVRVCWLSLRAKSFIFQFAIQKI
jgi:hypothetical protein